MGSRKLQIERYEMVKMEYVLLEKLTTVQRLAVKALLLAVTKGGGLALKGKLPGSVITVLQQIVKSGVGKVLLGESSLPPGRYLNISGANVRIVLISQDGKAKVERRFGNLGRVLTKFSTELWLRLSGTKTRTKTGLIETKNKFKKLRADLTPRSGATILKEHLRNNVDRNAMINIIRNHRPVNILK